MGGRITLIKATLSNLPVYYMSLFKMPAKISQKVEKLKRDFLWERGLNKDHLVGWKEVCRTKEGGLGIGRIKEKNMALMSKWLGASQQKGTIYGTLQYLINMDGIGLSPPLHLGPFYGKIFSNWIPFFPLSLGLQ